MEDASKPIKVGSRTESASAAGDDGTDSTGEAADKPGGIITGTLRGRKQTGDASKGASRTPIKSAVDEDEGSEKRPVTRSGPRKVRLTLSRLDPFSVMKLSFLVAIAFGIALVVAVALIWNVLDVTGVWDAIDKMGKDLTGGESLPFMEYLAFGKMLSYSIVVAFADLLIITAMGTLLAVLYNIVAALLGGLKLTFTDE
jgi:hypothetical protein